MWILFWLHLLISNIFKRSRLWSFYVLGLSWSLLNVVLCHIFLTPVGGWLLVKMETFRLASSKRKSEHGISVLVRWHKLSYWDDPRIVNFAHIKKKILAMFQILVTIWAMQNYCSQSLLLSQLRFLSQKLKDQEQNSIHVLHKPAFILNFFFCVKILKFNLTLDFYLKTAIKHSSIFFS